ncbi:unnamed protein product, partial [Ectocarpus sp. 8 AP-2014]
LRLLRAAALLPMAMARVRLPPRGLRGSGARPWAGLLPRVLLLLSFRHCFRLLDRRSYLLSCWSWRVLCFPAGSRQLAGSTAVCPIDRCGDCGGTCSAKLVVRGRCIAENRCPQFSDWSTFLKGDFTYQTTSFSRTNVSQEVAITRANIPTTNAAFFLLEALRGNACFVPQEDKFDTYIFLCLFLSFLPFSPFERWARCR